MAKAGETTDFPFPYSLLPLWRAAVAFEVNFSEQMSIGEILAGDGQWQIPFPWGTLLAEDLQDWGSAGPPAPFQSEHTSGDEAEALQSYCV